MTSNLKDSRICHRPKCKLDLHSSQITIRTVKETIVTQVTKTELSLAININRIEEALSNIEAETKVLATNLEIILTITDLSRASQNDIEFHS